jgi:hypothetical protein
VLLLLLLLLLLVLLQVLPSASAAELEGLMEGLLLLEVQVRAAVHTGVGWVGSICHSVACLRCCVGAACPGSACLCAAHLLYAPQLFIRQYCASKASLHAAYAAPAADVLLLFFLLLLLL